MKRMKKFLATGLAVVMVSALFAGCGKKEEATSGNNSGSNNTTSSNSSTNSNTNSNNVTPDASTTAPTDTGSAQGKTLRIYCWNTEFQERFEQFFPQEKLGDVKVDWVINANEDNVYQTKLDEALLKQASLAEEDRIDLFLVEADYALKYVGTEFTLDVINEIGRAHV